MQYTAGTIVVKRILAVETSTYRSVTALIGRVMYIRIDTTCVEPMYTSKPPTPPSARYTEFTTPLLLIDDTRFVKEGSAFVA